MKAHLTTEEFTNRLLEIPSITVDAHLLDCDACRIELDKMRSSMVVFRSAAHNWSENAAAMDQSVVVVARRRNKAWVAEWAVAAAFLLVLVVLPALYFQNRKNPSNTVANNNVALIDRQTQITQDNELLSAVNSEIAEGVPAPMQPLRVSLSYGSASPVNQAK